MPILALAEHLTAGEVTFLVVAIGLALAFEFVNGFHDTANAVATVIYTHTLRPWFAVIWSGIWNLIGVLASSGAVAYSILALLPVELVINVGTGAGFAMIFALLTSAIAWNVGTWYLGLPASSSHTLVGSILGVGLANAVMAGHGVAHGLNWGQVHFVFLSLLVSPVVGFASAALLLLALKRWARDNALFTPPPPGQPPPPWIRGTLIATCTGVSFAHGSNDGQKGMGLLLLILIGILPAEYALNLHARADDLRELEASAAIVQPMLDAHAADAAVDPAMRDDADATPKPAPGGALLHAATSANVATTGPGALRASAVENAGELTQYLTSGGRLTTATFEAVAAANREISTLIAGKASLRDVAPDDRKTLRTDLFLVDQTLAKLNSTGQITEPREREAFATYRRQLDATTKYIPTWVKVAVALALGGGTMIGWKRIVTTVGERIGRQPLTYAQGASAELVAMTTIGLADRFGMPVSTTHVLSSGIAGTMAANRSGLQGATVRNILLAWLLTLPVCILLGAATFAAGLYVVRKDVVAETTGALLIGVAVLLALRVRAAARRRAVA